jgi:serine/threonine-protein kinase
VAAPPVLAVGPTLVPSSRPGGAPTQVVEPTAVMPAGSGGAYGPYGPEGPEGPGGPGGPPRRYQPRPPKQNKGPMIALVVLAVIAVFALAALIGRALLGGDEGNKTQAVPSVVNSTEAEAKDTLTNAGFKPVVDASCAKFSNDFDKGTVMSQTPTGGAQAEPNSAVTLCLSKGVQMVTIPANITDMTPDEAEQALKDLGFDVQRVDQANAEVDEGNVIGTSPEAGKRAAKGSTVKLYISTGPEQVQVPDVRGKQVDEATSILQDKGFNVEVTEVDYPDAREGTVLEQDPRENSTVDAGSTVRLTVAKQPEQQLITVRSVIGLPEDQAKQQLEADGLKVTVQPANPPDPTKQDGVIISQSIAAGTQVAPDTQITIYVNKLSGGG